MPGIVDRSAPLVLALDVGGTKTVVAAVRGAPTDGFRPIGPLVRFATPRHPGAFLEHLTAAAHEAMAEHRGLAAVGIGVPGPLDARRGVVVSSPNMGWRDVPIASLVSECFGGVSVVIDDDSNAGALGEAVAGAGRGADPFAYLPLGTGLGSGIVSGGRVITGAHGAAGEVGHMAVDVRAGPRCSCGRRNCVEAWCAGAGLARRSREVWPSRLLEDGSPAPRDAASVFALARRGDMAALTLLGQARHALASAMTAIMATVDPAVMTVGGSIGAAEPAFVRSAFREARRRVHGAADRGIRLRPPQLRDTSVLGGAAVMGARAAHGH